MRSAFAQQVVPSSLGELLEEDDELHTGQDRGSGRSSGLGSGGGSGRRRRPRRAVQLRRRG